MNLKAVGLIIIVMGFILTIYTGFNFNTKDKILDLGGFQITKDKEHSINWSPFIGIGAIVIGGVVFSFGGRKPERMNAN
jgi:formate-dependent nitrite reductase membrane component NrfD